MPKKDGFEVAGISEASILRSIIFLSARDVPTDRLKETEMGADDCLTKPFSMENYCFVLRSNSPRPDSQEESPTVPFYNWVNIASILSIKS